MMDRLKNYFEFMKPLYESILDTNIVDKANKRAMKILKYYENLKTMYDMFWTEIQTKIIEKYNIDTSNIKVSEKETKKGDVTIVRKSIEFKISSPITKSKHIVQCIKEDTSIIFTSLYRKIFKKSPDSVIVDNKRNYIDFYNDDDVAKDVNVIRWGGLTIGNESSDTLVITISMRYVKR